MKYTQQQETRYENNEYKNMPSIDYGVVENQMRLHTATKDCVEWDIVKQICGKYGFDFTIINGTFCRETCNDKDGFAAEFIVYKKIDFDIDTYENWEKNNNYDKVRELDKNYYPLMRKLHDCVHELDEETNLVFKVGWAGNVGLFGSDDVYRQTYSFGRHLTDWHYIIDRWHPSIHDTSSKLKKGLYLMMTTRFLKRT